MTVNSTDGILIKMFFDHQSYFMCLNTVYTKDHPTKYMKTKQQNQSNIETLSTDIANSNLMDKIDKSSKSDPK